MLKRFLIYTIVILTASSSFSFAQEWDRAEALTSMINPHEQIDDEGDILWGKCLICHQEVPNIKEAKSIADVKIRYEEDMKMLCYRCHPEAMHPGGAWTGLALGREVGAPNHWIKPPDYIAANIKLSLKEYPIILPMEPKTGKIFCATCHNPHERGLLAEKADKGADNLKRLRGTGGPVCQFCHRK
jgi:hypothetical protein